MPTLTILISTLDDGLARVPGVLLPPDERVCYVVVWQRTRGASVEAQKAALLLRRSDVTLVEEQETGLSRSRNTALTHCTTPLAIFCDDDVRYRPDAPARILAAFDARPDSDVLCFRAEDGEGNPLKPYPDTETDRANWPRGYAASSVEIAVRLRYDTPRFDTRFGLGSAELVCGEEDVFLHECAARGHRITFVPETILSTDGDTTSTRLSRHPKFLRSKGAALRTVHGLRGAWMRAAKYALQAPYGERAWRFRAMAQGIRYIGRTAQEPRMISVVIPYLDRAATLPRLFRSLLAVDYAPLEIILVDNGSEDGSLQLCETFRKEHANHFARVALLAEPERSAAAARNRGFLSARGEYVYFFDSDDEISPTFFRDAAPYMGRYDAICARTRMVFEGGKTKVRRRVVPTTAAAQILGGILSTQTCLVRRTLYFQEPLNHGWEPRLSRWDDLEWGLRVVLTARSVKWLDGAYHRIHRHADSLSGPSLWDDQRAIAGALTACLMDIAGGAAPWYTESGWQQRAANAIYARMHLVLDKMVWPQSGRRAKRKETEMLHQAMETFFPEGTPAPTPQFRRRISLLFKVWPHRVPGLWRVLLALC